MATDRLKNISVSKEVWTQLKLLEAEKDCTHTQVLEYLLERSKQLDEVVSRSTGTIGGVGRKKGN